MEMKDTTKKIIASALITAMAALPVASYAGNPDRAGSAGASELLINPYAGSSGWANANTSCVRGLEAMFSNIAGTALTRKTEVLFTHTLWLGGSGVSINNFGLTQHVGSTGAIGINVFSMSAGQIPITTTDQPEGTGSTFSPSLINVALSYAKGFSDNIYGGASIRVIQEALSNVKSTGVALDAGIQYMTGKYDQIHIGIALRNVGPKMTYAGDGLSFTTNLNNGTLAGYSASFDNKSSSFNLPSMLNIGGAYDFYLTKDSSGFKKDYRITVAANFTSNSFTNDIFSIGTEIAIRRFLMVRGGYAIERQSTNNASLSYSPPPTTGTLTGPSFGATVQIPFGKEKKSNVGLDYSYRFTNTAFAGVNTFGIRVTL
ncbi:MAG: PorV/PorQ family protein [Bacteroidetes bacterium]|nr:PorV/PorQ family protein [Bacteroidota bacterium]